MYIKGALLKGIISTNVFQKILDAPNHKPNKIWVNKSGEFYNRSMKSFLQDNSWYKNVFNT